MKFNFAKLLMLGLTFVLLCSGTYGDIASRLIKNYSKQVNKTDGLKVFGTGGGGLGHIKSIFICYTSSKKVDITEARRLFIKIANGFIEQINVDRKFQEYAQGSKFEANNLELSIMFIEPKTNDFYKDHYVASISMEKGKLLYVEDFGGKLKTLLVESYEEALNALTGSLGSSSISGITAKKVLHITTT